MASLRRKMAGAAAWMIGAKLLERSLGLVSTLILARLLMPADFGLVAMATALAALLELFTAFGFDTALIAKQRPDRRYYDTAFTLNVLCGVLLAALLLAAAWPAARFYNEPRLVAIIAVLALIAVIQSFENVGVVAFRKELDFRREFMFLGGKKLVTFAITIPLAFSLRSYWALLIGMCAGRIAGVALSYLAHPYRPRFDLSARAELLGFSVWVLVQGMLHFVRTRYAELVVGRIAGSNTLGLFAVGAEIGSLPGSELIAPINRAIFPAYAQIADDLSALRSEYRATIAMIALIVMPAALGIGAIAPLLVPLALGEPWRPAIEVVHVMAWTSAILALQSNAHAVFLARNKPWLSAWAGGPAALLLVILLPLLGATMGLRGVLFGILIAYAATAPLLFGLLMREIELTLAALLGAIVRPILAAGVMYALVMYFVASQPAQPTWTGLIIAIVLGAACYPFVLLVAWLACGRPNGVERALITQMSRLLAQVRAR